MNTVPQLPSERPYHRLARTPSYRWWRPLVELVAFAVAVAALLAVGSAALPAAVAHSVEHGGVAGLIGISSTLAVGIPAAKLAAAGAGRSAGGLSSVIGRLRWRWLGRCSLVALVLYAVAIPVDLAVDPRHLAWPGWTTFAPLGLAILVFVPLQAAGEEYAFRGTLLQMLGAWVPFSWLVVAITSVAFAAVHGQGGEVFVGTLVSGILMGWLAIRTGGLEASIALHAVNNVTAFMLTAASGGGDTLLSRLNHDISWASVALGVVIQVVYAAIVVEAYESRCEAPSARRIGSWPR